MAAQADRKLVPIVSLDVVGYSRLTEHNERQTLRLVQRVYDRLVARTIGRQGGKVFKTMGDGLLAEFQSVVAAVEWVAALQRELSERRLKVPGGGHLQIRAGVVLADVLVAGDDLYGSGVNLSVRVQVLSPPGGMAITKWMYQYLDGRTDLQFVDLGPTELKNVSRTVRLYVWHPEGVTQKNAAATASEPIPIPQSSRPSVVVLPFDNLSGEADQAYFADAVVEEITATLSRIKDFFVIARNSAFAYKGRAIDVRQVGKELGVRYAVEGSVRRVGERVRITTQLVETDSGNHIWSTKVDGAVSDLFDLQDKVAAEVASAIQPSIRRVEVERARSKRPETMAAYDLVMRALPHLWAHRMAENPHAIAFLSRALQLEPNYGLAAGLCAWAHGQQVAYNWATDVAAERAEGERLIELATQTVGDDPTALTALASAMMQLGGDVPQAVNFAERALALDPNHSWAWMRLGYGRVYLGRPEEGLKAFEQSARLSPLDPFAFNVHLGMGLAHFSAGRPDRAIEMARQALAERPGLTWPYRDLSTYYAASGRMEQARDALDKFVYLRPAMTAATLRDGLRFMEPALLDRYVGGLQRAGLT
ncbi:MAG: tetratricopeptide repeat protein [Devosia sp.]|uniref:adenylate/guanylate cyclase domain-containing protein n=1 Tax=Devosia sp. TaxID=1871048 RepID=UPI001A3DC964|nr:adenylate/guanylate cyclase domain-containing protein [Devosia sp.]MBL8599046.1 tetratricopeptide repeat protein [Devosia sp.]